MTGPALLLFMSLALNAAPVRAAEIAGVVSAVQDGRSFTVNGTAVRVFGIDAPDLRQQCRADAIYEPGPSPCVPCGAFSRRALSELILGKEVVCKDRGRAGDVVMAECTVGKILVGPWMLSNGRAVVDAGMLTKADRPLYPGAELSGKRAAMGLWSMTFVPPKDWREGKRMACEG